MSKISVENPNSQYKNNFEFWLLHCSISKTVEQILFSSAFFPCSNFTSIKCYCSKVDEKIDLVVYRLSKWLC